jgi:hypothetical protein
MEFVFITYTRLYKPYSTYKAVLILRRLDEANAKSFLYTDTAWRRWSVAPCSLNFGTRCR